MSDPIPAEAVQAIAEKLYRDHDSEFGADHLSWRDFEGQARDLLAVAAPLLAEHIADLIKALCPEPDAPHVGDHCDYRHAAQVTREAFPKGEADA